ncbi:MAG: large subunit ribosomal protein L25 [Candidatus Marinamargulisbacteria bacterium]|jgi:large subunit ribosomal protein L25
METTRFEAKIRKEFKKNKVKKLRAEGFVPATVYGEKIEPISVTVNERDLIKLYKSEARKNILITLVMTDGDKRTEESVISYHVETDAITQRIIHVDFMKVIAKKPIQVVVRAVLDGVAPGAKMGGVLVHKLNELRISCLPSQIPTNIMIDVSGLMVGDFIRIKDIDTEGKFTILQAEDDTIVRLAAPRTAVEMAALDDDVESGEEGAEGAEGAEGDEAADTAEKK